MWISGSDDLFMYLIHKIKIPIYSGNSTLRTLAIISNQYENLLKLEKYCSILQLFTCGTFFAKFEIKQYSDTLF